MSGTTAVKVSVIVPVYNAKKTIRDCLEAIVGQTLKEIEVICVDDGSKDGSWKVIEEIRQKDDRVRLIRQENQGAGVARNVGMKEARGDYLVFLDSDDYFRAGHAPERLGMLPEDRRGSLRLGGGRRAYRNGGERSVPVGFR